MGLLRKGQCLHPAVIERLRPHQKGKVLDIGTGRGDLAAALSHLGFDVSACDLYPEKLRESLQGIEFRNWDVNQGLPYPEESFEYVVCLEVIEHVENPFALLREIKRVLRPGGLLFISTPNILHMNSRVRFLLEGAYDYFKYPIIEWEADGSTDLHVNPIRFHEMEYYVSKSGMKVEDVFTSVISYRWRLFFPLELLIRLQMGIKVLRSLRPREIRMSRLFSTLKRDDLLYGEHLIMQVRKT